MNRALKFKKRPPVGKPAPAPAKKSSLKHWALLAACLAVACAGTWAVFEYVVWNVLPPALVGTWEVIDGPPEYKEAVFEFHRSGKMVGHLNDNGNLRIMKAETRVEGNKIHVTTRRPSTGEEHISVQTIRTLTADRMVLEDERGSVLRFQRAE